MAEYLLGIDIGSGGCKVALLNTEKTETEVFSEEYPTLYPSAGRAEQNAEDWIHTAGRLLGQMFDKTGVTPDRILALGVSGVTHSPVLLDSERRVIGRVIHLTDARSGKQAEGLHNREGEYILRTCGNGVNVMWTAPMLLWVKENRPESWHRISKILFPKDYLRFRLTGTEVTDHIDAEGTLLFNRREKKWDEKLLRLVSLRPEQLPETVHPTRVVGRVNGSGAEWSGLKSGTPVIAGTTDTLLELLASGMQNPGDCTVKLATFGRICVITDKPYQDEKLITYSYIMPGRWYPGTGTKSFASSLRWFRDQFCRDILEEDPFRVMEDEARETGPGAAGLLFHPYLQGEGSPYNDPYLRGDFIGLSLYHTRGDLIRAVMEGTAFSLLDCIEYLRKKGVGIKSPVRYIGGGTRGKLWPQIVADVLGMDGVKPRATDPSIGAALLAGVGIGFFSSVTEAQKLFSGKADEIIHDKERNGLYRELFVQYKKTAGLLTDVYHDLGRFATD
jgi:xylulokinase